MPPKKGSNALGVLKGIAKKAQETRTKAKAKPKAKSKCDATPLNPATILDVQFTEEHWSMNSWHNNVMEVLGLQKISGSTPVVLQTACSGSSP